MLSARCRTVFAIGLTLTVAFAHAQTKNDVHDAGPAPRLPDGRVDFGGKGVWSLPNANNRFESRVVGKDARELFLPWTRAMYRYHQANDSRYDPEGFCLPPGGPRSMGTPYPAQIIQDRDRIVIIFEGGAHVWREIYMDGREMPPADKLTPSYFGYSIGRYEDGGDTLVVETSGFNEKTWINAQGYMHTDELSTIERFSRPNLKTLHYEATIIDPGAYTEPWRAAWDIPWEEDVDLMEYVCQGDNQFLMDLKDDLGNPFFSDIDY
jgi:hypothetical protein